ncbi:hypothetical protein WR25_16787 [Diploscapter pachys]|uniref:Uncharacterized protein n=1 Tax=Diploscapter pachys TaxID=2018661 RepID=A0A2A2LJ13_9BILA|nr:hypothetical protein WR25_16787 [Diploscapter pachys]
MGTVLLPWMRSKYSTLSLSNLTPRLQVDGAELDVEAAGIRGVEGGFGLNVQRSSPCVGWCLANRAGLGSDDDRPPRGRAHVHRAELSVRRPQSVEWSHWGCVAEFGLKNLIS